MDLALPLVLWRAVAGAQGPRFAKQDLTDPRCSVLITADERDDVASPHTGVVPVITPALIGHAENPGPVGKQLLGLLDVDEGADDENEALLFDEAQHGGHVEGDDGDVLVEAGHLEAMLEAFDRRPLAVGVKGLVGPGQQLTVGFGPLISVAEFGVEILQRDLPLLNRSGVLQRFNDAASIVGTPTRNSAGFQALGLTASDDEIEILSEQSAEQNQGEPQVSTWPLGRYRAPDTIIDFLDNL